MAKDQALVAEETQHVHPVLVAGDQALAAVEAQHVPPMQQVLVAEDIVLAKEAQCVRLSSKYMSGENNPAYMSGGNNPAHVRG